MSEDLALVAGELQGHVFTSRYQQKELLRGDALAKIRITLGAPRFLKAMGYELDGTIMAFAPSRETFAVKESDAFRRAYLGQLEAVGPTKALELIQGARAEAGGRDVVMLCYEDVIVKQEECHRRLLAEWLGERCGLVVPELTVVDEARLL